MNPTPPAHLTDPKHVKLWKEAARIVIGNCGLRSLPRRGGIVLVYVERKGR